MNALAWLSTYWPLILFVAGWIAGLVWLNIAAPEDTRTEEEQWLDQQW